MRIKGGCEMKQYKRLTNQKWSEDIDLTQELGYSYIYKRLYDLEDEIEAGTLVELPCKVGDVMYEVIDGIPIQEWKIESICFDRAHPTGVIWAERTRDFARWKFWIEDCGIKWFVTKAEAEKRLEEIRSGNEN